MFSKTNLTRNRFDRGIAVGLLRGLCVCAGCAFCGFVFGGFDHTRLEAVLCSELLHATGRVQDLLFSSEEWVARAAQFNRDRLDGRAGLIHGATSTRDG